MRMGTATATIALGGFLAASAASALTLTSPDVKQNAKMADEQVFNDWGCPGKNISPALNWSGAPKGTKSFAVNVYDPDAPTGSGFWHWYVVNIPADATSLAKGAGDPKANALPAGTVQAKNDFGAIGYGVPCPPKGAKPHRYQFTVFALDVDKLDVNENASAAVFGFNVLAHTLAKATLTGLWGH
jgi:Raf kinase inhibitor-like YbhB/YbcL family protein